MQNVMNCYRLCPDPIKTRLEIAKDLFIILFKEKQLKNRPRKHFCQTKVIREQYSMQFN